MRDHEYALLDGVNRSNVGRVIGSLLRQDYAGPFRIILVDDNSSDGTAAAERLEHQNAGDGNREPAHHRERYSGSRRRNITRSEPEHVRECDPECSARFEDERAERITDSARRGAE